MFFKLGVRKNFANFIGKQLCLSLLLIKLETHFYRTLPVDASVRLMFSILSPFNIFTLEKETWNIVLKLAQCRKTFNKETFYSDLNYIVKLMTVSVTLSFS